MLFWLWFVTFVIGLIFLVFMSNKGYVGFAGKVITEYQKGNKCISEIDWFVATTDGKCRFFIGKKVMVFGTTKWNLITALRGKMDLVSATIYLIDESNQKKFDVGFVEKSLSVFADYCTDLYSKFLPHNESALLSGIVFGKKTDIGYGFYSQMVKSGTVHIAVASGFNLMLLGGFILYPLFYLWGRKWATFVAICFLFLYAVITGFDPPMIRAWLMISLLFVGLACGRKQEGWWTLLVSIWIILVWDTTMLWNVSFQLSVMASIGLIVVAPLVIKFASDMGYEKEVRFLERVGFLSTAAAMALTTPVIWYHFGRVSFLGLFSNLLVLPLVPPVMVLGLLMIVLPSVFYLPAYALLHTLVVLIEFFGT